MRQVHIPNKTGWLCLSFLSSLRLLFTKQNPCSRARAETIQITLDLIPGRMTETWLTQTAASCILRSRRGRPSLCHTDPNFPQSSRLFQTPNPHPNRPFDVSRRRQAVQQMRSHRQMAVYWGRWSSPRPRDQGEKRKERDGHVTQPVEDLCPLTNPSCRAMALCERGPVSPFSLSPVSA